VNVPEVPPDCVLVRFPELPAQLEGLEPNVFPIFRYTASDQGCRRDNRPSISQFPLTPAFCITGHKTQGQTISKLAIHLRTSGTRPPQAWLYVQVSRVRTLNGLFFFRRLTMDDVKHFRPHPTVLNAMHFLEELQQATLRHFRPQIDLI
jgi:hypothetical protein